MNIVIVIFLISVLIVNAEVVVIPVVVGFWYSSHAKELTRIINFKEREGCVLFKIDSFNSATYLYFRCPRPNNTIIM